MKAINTIGLTPLSVLAKTTEPRKNFSLQPTISQSKNQTFPNFDGLFSVSRSFQGGLVLLSSVLNPQISKALTYEEALQQSVTSNSDIDFSGVLENVINFAAENPVIIGGGLAVVAAPLVVSRLLLGNKSKPWGVLLDIRSTVDIKQVGAPDIGGLKKKAVAIVYKGEDKPGFLNKLSLKFKEPENTTLFILDKFDGNSELVAELVTANGFKAAYAIKDGAEGSRGWKNSGLPWILPKKASSLNLSNLTDAFGEASDFVPLTLGVAAAVGLGLLTFTEVETILQVLGSAALVQFVSKKLLFAEDRKQTIQQIEEVLNTKIAAKELVGDIKQIGKAFLPPIVTSKTLSAPADVTPPPSDSAVQKSESIPEVNNVPPKVEAAPKVNSVPKAEVQKESLSTLSRPLSPYPNVSFS
ncbi:hypothetical protein DH2020_025190 [Rehmannia glutinosa]|uniref:Rhodanese-like domain-containing protein 4, chloroplastic n=1 Tax=Rehmannia glutinosa TaxID=99300 RepID=A0ABR0W2V6_REHGL